MRNTTAASNKLSLTVLDFDRPKHHRSKESRLIGAFRKVQRWWIKELNASRDPKIWQTIDPVGNTWWHAYHPVTGCSATRESETEILEWIDRRVVGK